MSDVLERDDAAGGPWMIYDGDCGICQRSVAWLRRITGGRLSFLPRQSADVPARFPELSPAGLEQAVHLVTSDLQVHRGAAAIFLAMTLGNRRWHGWPWRIYRGVPGARTVAEAIYRWVARHRHNLSRRCAVPRR